MSTMIGVYGRMRSNCSIVWFVANPELASEEYATEEAAGRARVAAVRHKESARKTVQAKRRLPVKDDFPNIGEPLRLAMAYVIRWA